MPLGQTIGVLTAAKCRQFATSYKGEANEAGIPSRKAAILRNIAHSLTGLATQLEMLTASDENEKEPPRLQGW